MLHYDWFLLWFARRGSAFDGAEWAVPFLRGDLDDRSPSHNNWFVWSFQGQRGASLALPPDQRRHAQWNSREGVDQPLPTFIAG